MRFSTCFFPQWPRLTCLMLGSVCALTACDNEELSTAAPATTYYGQSVTLGQGKARTFVTSNASAKPQELGIRLAAAALEGLPAAPREGTTFELSLPAYAKTMLYDHVSLYWHPAGHAPEAVYGAPHFDAHFYRQTPAAQQAIGLDDLKGDLLPASFMVPAGYQTSSNAQAGRCIAKMGRRWMDMAGAEYEPSGRFTSAFGYGSYDGQVTFVAPMFTKSLLTPDVNVASSIKQPAVYPIAGLYYPQHYSIRYDAATQEYVLTLSELFQIPPIQFPG